MATVLITGATGFLGVPSARILSEKGYTVHAVARTVPVATQTGIRYHAIDLLDPRQVSLLFEQVRPTHLLHLAWISTSQGAYWFSSANRVWVGASLHLLTAFASRGGLRAVVAGSCAEYDWTGGGHFHEESPARPATLYGQCKNDLRLNAEHLARSLGISLAWARLFHLYGPGEQPVRLVGSVARGLLAGLPIDCTAGTQVRDFLHVDDAADALVTLLESPRTGIMNIGSGQGVRVGTVAETVARLVGRPDLLRMGARPTPSFEPPLLVADVGRSNRELGWSPRWGLNEGLAETVSWWRKHVERPWEDDGCG